MPLNEGHTKNMLRSLFPLSFFLSPFEDETYWNGLPFPSPGNLPDPGIEPGSPTLQADSLPYEPPGKLLFLKELLKFLLFSLLHCHLAPSECHLLQLSWTLAFSSETISSSIWSHRCPIRNPFSGLHHDQSEIWSPEHVILALESAQLPL